MASLNKLAIRGIRSFDDKQISVIEFFTPVTVIVGHNGSGKTTIIEATRGKRKRLKYTPSGHRLLEVNAAEQRSMVHKAIPMQVLYQTVTMIGRTNDAVFGEGWNLG